MTWPKDNVGYAGSMSPPGADGGDGAPGAAATIAVGTVTDVPYGTPPTVTNVGTSAAAIFDFELETGDEGDPGLDGDNAYVYIAYASTDVGTDFTTTFDPDLDYIAILTTDIIIPSPDATDFATLWKNYKGATGAPGTGHAIIDENGDPVTARANLEFTGTGVTVTDATPNTVVTITGGGTGLFDIDINGDLEPVTATVGDAYWDLDGNDDLQPKAV
jgi:hypothetical protein